MRECSYISLRENASRDAHPWLRPSIKRMQRERFTDRNIEQRDTLSVLILHQHRYFSSSSSDILSQ